MTTNGTASFDTPRSTGGNPIRWLILGGVLLIAAIAVGTAVMIGSFRDRALSSSERMLEANLLLLARHYDEQLGDLEAVHKEIAAHIQSAEIGSSEAFRSRMSTLEAHELLRVRLSAFSRLGGINLFDSDGWLINSSGVWPVPDINTADRAYLKTFKSNPSSPPVLVEPVYSRDTGTWTTVFAYKLTGRNGELLGVVERAVKPAQFERFLESVALGEGASIAMFHYDGTLLARYPHIETSIGRNFKPGPLRERAMSKVGYATMRLISPVDGQYRLTSARALANFPIMITSTIAVPVALADWREQTRFLIGAASLAVLVIAALLFLVVRKLSQQHRSSQQRLGLEKRRLDTAVNNMTQGLLLFDSSQRLIVCNQRYVDMFGLSPDVVKPGCTLRELISHRKETGTLKEDIDEHCALVLRNAAQNAVIMTETPDGRSIQITYRTVAGGGWVTTLEDVTERRQAEERIAHLAHYDALTNLPNRTLFHEHLKRALACIAPDRQLAVFYIDIDEFKSVNDSLGHLVGDELLKSVAASLSRCVGTTNFVARLGGDEFAIVQTGISAPADVTDFVARIFDAIREPYECLGHQLTTDASIGIALAPEHSSDLDQIMKNADLAMSAAKSAGRSTYRFFEPSMDEQVKARRKLEMDLRQAIADRALQVYYQPCVSLRDDAITGCEALVRWRHPERGMISPAEFIPIAEDTGLINQLGEWALTTACAEAATWPDDIRVAVNVSPVQFRSGTLALKIVAALAASGLPANRLELEITEAVLIRDDEAALAILHQLRAIGVRIALDDFGTGYSSLSYLQRFPFDKIKIDRCFIGDIAESGGSSSIVKAVVDIAAARDMITTAEGVETEQQRELLRALGCSEMQGWLFSAAKPAADIRQLFRAHREKSSAVA